MDCVHLMIHGFVQGVYFRANTQREAINLGLRGWVRNTEDGCVEAMAAGDRQKLNEFISWCRRGPAAARVDHIDISWEGGEGLSDGFHVRG